MNKLTISESDLAANFFEKASAYQMDSFEQITLRVLGREGFTREHTDAFRAECRSCFDLARVKRGMGRRGHRNTQQSNQSPRLTVVQRAKSIVLDGVELQLKQCVKCDIEFYGGASQLKCGECRKIKRKRA